MTEQFKFKSLYFFRYFGDAFFYPFFSLYLLSIGIEGGQLGVILAITPLTSIIVNPFWTTMSKDVNMNRKILRVITLIEALVIIFFTTISGFTLAVILTCLLASVATPFYSLNDGFCATYCTMEGKEYSSFRFYGSIGYILASIMGGTLILWFGYSFVFYLSAFFFIVTSAILSWLKPLNLETYGIVKSKRRVSLLFKNFEFMKYLVFYVLAMGTMLVGDSFYGVFLNTRGVNTSGYGLIFAMFVTFEAMILLVMSKIGERFQAKYLFLIAASLVVIRFSVNGTIDSLPVLIAFATLRGLAWGLMLYVNLRYIIKIVRIENVTIAMMVLLVAKAAYIGIGNIIAGRISGIYGYERMYLILALIAFLSMIFFIFFTPKRFLKRPASHHIDV